MIFAVLKGVAWSAVSTTTGRIVMAITALFVAWQVDRAWQRGVGAQRVVEKSIQAGKEINETNAKIRREAAKPGAFKRLLSDSCRDC